MHVTNWVAGGILELGTLVAAGTEEESPEVGRAGHLVLGSQVEWGSFVAWGLEVDSLAVHLVAVGRCAEYGLGQSVGGSQVQGEEGIQVQWVGGIQVQWKGGNQCQHSVGDMQDQYSEEGSQELQYNHLVVDSL